jgi:hypothetical protein
LNTGKTATQQLSDAFDAAASHAIPNQPTPAPAPATPKP